MDTVQIVQKGKKQMIEVKNLTKYYGNHKAVDHISFSIKEGTVCGFLGPNGAGKSTTMNIMTGCLSHEYYDGLSVCHFRQCFHRGI